MTVHAVYGENIVCVGCGWGRDECNKKVSTEQYIWERGSGGGNGKGLSETSQRNCYAVEGKLVGS